MKFKICTKCKILLPATLKYFYADKQLTDGLRCECKKCTLWAQKRYYQTHRDAHAEQVKKYRQTQAGKRADYYGHKRYHSTIKGYLHRIYAAIKYRCNNPKTHNYKNYGGRGIQNKFNSLDDFRNYVKNDLGYDTYDKIKGLEIDRIDNDGNYEKGNIRFVTCKENNNNRRDNV